MLRIITPIDGEGATFVLQERQFWQQSGEKSDKTIPFRMVIPVRNK